MGEGTHKRETGRQSWNRNHRSSDLHFTAWQEDGVKRPEMSFPRKMLVS